MPVAPLSSSTRTVSSVTSGPQPIDIVVHDLDFAGGDIDPGDVVDGGTNHPGILREDIERPGVNILADCYPALTSPCPKVQDEATDTSCRDPHTEAARCRHALQHSATKVVNLAPAFGHRELANVGHP